ncbi:AAA family ATPase [Kaarinaea lacus]
MTNSNTNTPSYVAFYGMSRDPFSPEIEEDIFYAEPTRKQRLDVLLHLTEYGNEVMVVIGPKGSGKSTLLSQFQKNKHEDWKVAHVEIQEGFDERKFLQQLFKQMDLAFRGASFNDLLEYIEKHFRQLQENSVLPVILIDNADQLPITGIKKVLEMASLTNDESKPLIRVIMFGTEKIKEQIKDPLLGHLANLPIRSMELPPLTEEQTVHYILHRTLSANFNGNDIFNESAILKIYRESFGWPARINEVCRNLLLKSVPSKSQGEMVNMDTKGRNPRQVLLAGIAIAVLAAVLVFQNNVSEIINKSRDLFSSLSDSAQSNGQPKELATAGQQTSTSKTAESAEPETLVEKLRSRNPAYQETAEKPAQTDDKTDIPETTVPVTSQAEKPGTPEPAAKQPIIKQTYNSKLGIEHGNDWFLQQDAGHFTLQVVAGENLDTINEFVKKHKLTDNIALYHSLRKSKPWYGLVYGQYENKQQAVNAANQPTLKKFKPWIRSLGGIQKDIRKLPVASTDKMESLVEKLSKPQPAQPVTTVKEVATQQVQPVEIARQEEWILRQRYNHYTLQLMASENIDAINRFVLRHKLKDSIALYQINKDDKTWHVLIYGIYSNQPLAESGIGHLPASLQRVRPVIRQFSDIHKEIKNPSP